MTKKLLIGILVGIVIAVFVCTLIGVAGWYFFFKNSNSKSVAISDVPVVTPVVSQPASTLIPGSSINATGILLTAGLDSQQTDAAKIADYQLTYLVPAKNPIPTAEGFFLGGSSPELKSYLGKCVSVTGKISGNWGDQTTIDENYSRSFIEVSKVSIENFDSCKTGIETIPAEEGIAGEPTTFNGTVAITSRPAPDISYDFTMKLTTPYIDKNNASGEDLTVNTITIIPTDFATMQNLTTSQNKKIKIDGYFTWGLSESKAFFVEKVTVL